MPVWQACTRIAWNTSFLASRVGVLCVTDEHVTVDKDEGVVTKELEGFQAEALSRVRWRRVEPNCLVCRTSGIGISKKEGKLEQRSLFPIKCFYLCFYVRSAKPPYPSPDRLKVLWRVLLLRLVQRATSVTHPLWINVCLRYFDFSWSRVGVEQQLSAKISRSFSFVFKETWGIEITNLIKDQERIEEYRVTDGVILTSKYRRCLSNTDTGKSSHV